MPKITKPVLVGVGMPANEYLKEFGSLVMDAFGSPPYLVGSAMHGKKWRDIDIRVILDDKEWEEWEFGDPKIPNKKHRVFNMAFAELGRRMTGLPVDFQIQQRTFANEHYKDVRSALFVYERVD